jgi:prolyl 4-hydroxylase
MTMSAAAPDPEFQALVRAKYSGNPVAITALGARLVVGCDAPFAPVDGAALIAEAAQQGDAQAWGYVAVLAAAGVGRAQSWPDAFDALGRAADLGAPQAAQQLQLLRDMGVRGGADTADWLCAASGQNLREAPRFVTYAGFLTPAVCAYLIDRSASKLVQARVHDVNRGVLKVDAMRTNTGAALSLIETDLVIQLIRARIACAAGVAVEALEPPEILHYAIGERYKPHVDFFHPAVPEFAEQLRVKGQRVKTCLVYLNDDFEGGETDFPKIELRFRGRTGEALIFENVRADGAVDMNTQHAGLPPTRGEKWLLSQWIRDKPQRVA